MIAVPHDEWLVFGQYNQKELVGFLKHLAKNTNLSKFKKHPRGPKKPAVKRKSDKKHPHVSTARLLAARKKKNQHLERAGARPYGRPRKACWSAGQSLARRRPFPRKKSKQVHPNRIKAQACFFYLLLHLGFPPLVKESPLKRRR